MSWDLIASLAAAARVVLPVWWMTVICVGVCEHMVACDASSSVVSPMPSVGNTLMGGTAAGATSAWNSWRMYL